METSLYLSLLNMRRDRGFRRHSSKDTRYISYVAAVEDADRLLQHLVDRKRVQTFQKTLESTSRGKKRPNSFSDGTLHGAVRKLKKKDSSRKYKRYFRELSVFFNFLTAPCCVPSEKELGRFIPLEIDSSVF